MSDAPVNGRTGTRVTPVGTTATGWTVTWHWELSGPLEVGPVTVKVPTPLLGPEVSVSARVPPPLAGPEPEVTETGPEPETVIVAPGLPPMMSSVTGLPEVTVPGV